MAHELGHFLAARLLKVEVKRFSIGFGPKLAGLKRGPTEYRLSAVPLGGYVKLLGESLDDEVAPEKEAVSFAHKPVSGRLAIVAAGPVANFLLAVIVFAIILLIYGQPLLKTQVGKVLEGYPAAAAGLEVGDEILAVDDQPVRSWDEMAARIAGHGLRPLRLKVLRGEKIFDLVITPQPGEGRNIFGETVSKPMIGISPSGRTFTRRVGPGEALGGGFVQTWQVVKLTGLSLVKIIQRRIPLNTIGGPIFIAQAAGQQAKQGAASLLFFVGLISVNLGLLNLLPIPILDGGHMFFFAVEALVGRPVSVRNRERAQTVGLAVILLLMGLVFFNDLLRIFNQYFGPQ